MSDIDLIRDLRELESATLATLCADYLERLRTRAEFEKTTGAEFEDTGEEIKKFRPIALAALILCTYAVNVRDATPLAEGREHLTEAGDFRSDKYDWSHDGFVPLKITDKMAQPMLRAYADARKSKDAEFSRDLHEALNNAGAPPVALGGVVRPAVTIADMDNEIISAIEENGDPQSDVWNPVYEAMQRLREKARTP